MISRGLAAIFILCMAAATPAPARAPRHAPGKLLLPIAIVINGTRLSVNPSPRFFHNHLLVPVRRIIEALGLEFAQSGSRISTHAGYKSITLAANSTHASVDNEPVTLDAPPVEIAGTLYAPLRFFTQALGAQSQYDRQTNSVVITSTLVGRSGSGIIDSGSRLEEVGTITAVDLLSTPMAITLTYNASVRTRKLAPGAQIVVQDVIADTSNAGTMDALRPGDFAHVYLNKDRRVTRIVDAFGTRTGVIAAIAGSTFVMRDGQVITPDRYTTVSLNGLAASAGSLQRGDAVTVRYNIDSSQVQDIVVARPSTAALPAPAAVAIASLSLEAPAALRAGQKAYITLRGTRGGTATFDIGPYLVGLPMHESAPGTYTATYTVSRGVNFIDAPVFGHLEVAGVNALRVQSTSELSVASQPPVISDFAPEAGAGVNNDRPSIYATFATVGVPINPSSESITVNGHDVTSESTRTPRFIEYFPGISWPNGAVRVVVRVSDLAGNIATKTWTFSIKR